MILLPLLGLTWLFGVLTLNCNATIFAWLFTTFNSLQVSIPPTSTHTQIMTVVTCILLHMPHPYTQPLLLCYRELPYSFSMLSKMIRCMYTTVHRTHRAPLVMIIIMQVWSKLSPRLSSLKQCAFKSSLKHNVVCTVKVAVFLFLVTSVGLVCQ